MSSALDGFVPPCADDPELWFPTDAVDALEAERICRQCPAQLACLQLSIDNNEREGVWGGVTLSIGSVKRAPATIRRRRQAILDAHSKEK